MANAAEKIGATITELADDAHDCIMVRPKAAAVYKAVAEVFATSCKFPRSMPRSSFVNSPTRRRK